MAERHAEKNDTLTFKVRTLVDMLRRNDEQAVSLTDVASVSEILISTLRLYFRSLDMTIYQDCRDIARYIAKLRADLAEFRPDELQRHKIPRAGQELEAIVKSTEEATGTIMTAAEEMMDLDPGDGDQYKAKVDDACMRIFEACSFQDITGQRIAKVVNTLTFIEQRLAHLQDAWGEEFADVDGHAPTGDDALLNGPQLDGEGNDQDEVDVLMDGEAKSEAAGAEKTSDQADIDALFD